MGAYENPSMIVDKSGEILSQGFQSAAQSIAKGIDTYAQRYNKALEEQRKRAEEKKKEDAQANIRASQGSMRFVTDAKKYKIADQTSLTADFMENTYMPKIQELGDAYYNYGKVAYNVNSTEEEVLEATKGLNQIEADLKALQDRAAGGELILDAAKAVRDNRGDYGILAFDNLSTNQSSDLLDALSQGKNKGIVGDNIYEVSKDENNNEVYTFKNIKSGDTVFQQVVDTSDPNWIDNISVKKVNVNDEYANYAEENKIVVNNKLGDKFIKDTKFVVEKGVEYEIVNYNTQELLNQFQPLQDKLTAELTSFDADNPTNQNRVIRAFLSDNGYTQEEIDAIYEDGVSTEEEIAGAVQKFILNQATGNTYNIDENGNVFSKKSKGKYVDPNKPSGAQTEKARQYMVTLNAMDVKSRENQQQLGRNTEEVAAWWNQFLDDTPKMIEQLEDGNFYMIDRKGKAGMEVGNQIDLTKRSDVIAAIAAAKKIPDSYLEDYKSSVQLPILNK